VVTRPYEQPPPLPQARRRSGCLRTFVIALIALIVLLVAGDFAAKAFAENEVASQIKSHGFPKKPSVSIEGFPFLTQVLGKDIHEVKLSSKNVPEGPVSISSISAVMTGIHLHGGFTSISGATVDTLRGTVLVTFPSLQHTLNNNLGPLGSLLSSSGLTLSAAGPNSVKASLNLLVASGSATWRVIRLSGQDIQLRLVNSSGVPRSALSSVQNINIPIPKLPLGVKIDSVRIEPNGVVGHISGRDLNFGS
jgi:LmeA-like phospholipid-binding